MLKWFWTLLRNTYSQWKSQNPQRLGAALAFYALLSLAPLFMLIISAAGLIFGYQAAQGLIVNQISEFVGAANAKMIQDLLTRLYQPASGVKASVIGVLTLLLGASGVVGELQSSLKQIFGFPPQSAGWKAAVLNKLISVAFVMIMGFLLLTSLVLSAAIAAFGVYTPIPEFFLQACSIGLSFGTLTLLFALMYKILPRVKVSWRHAWIGAGVTSLLFTAGNFVLGYYLGRSSAASPYGAAGSLVLIPLWVYYCAQIVYFGAQFTRIYAQRTPENYSGSPKTV